MGSSPSTPKKSSNSDRIWLRERHSFEDGDGNPATANIARRGASGWTLTVTGTPAHSSQVFSSSVGYGAGKRPRSATIVITKNDGGKIGT